MLTCAIHAWTSRCVMAVRSGAGSPLRAASSWTRRRCLTVTPPEAAQVFPAALQCTGGSPSPCRRLCASTESTVAPGGGGHHGFPNDVGAFGGLEPHGGASGRCRGVSVRGSSRVSSSSKEPTCHTIWPSQRRSNIDSHQPEFQRRPVRDATDT